VPSFTSETVVPLPLDVAFDRLAREVTGGRPHAWGLARMKGETQAPEAHPPDRIVVFSPRFRILGGSWKETLYFELRGDGQETRIAATAEVSLHGWLRLFPKAFRHDFERLSDPLADLREALAKP